MNQKELESKLTIVNAQLDYWQNMKGDLEAEFAEAEKPELRHLEIGVHDFQKWLKINGQVFWIHDRDEVDLSEPSVCSDSTFLRHSHVNIIDVLDDLKARSKPLKDFTVDNGTSQTIKLGISGGFLRIRDSDGFMLIRECELPELILNLQRLVFTAGQEAAK